MLPSSISRLYYVGLALSFIQFGCACVNNYALLAPTQAEADSGEQHQVTHAGWLVVMGMLGFVTFAVWTSLLSASRPSRGPRSSGTEVELHIELLRGVAFLWIIVGALFAYPQAHGTQAGALSASCAANAFTGPGCATLDALLVLPFANVATLLCVVWAVSRRARAVHGEGPILIPARASKPRFAPAWQMAHVAELEPLKAQAV